MVVLRVFLNVLSLVCGITTMLHAAERSEPLPKQLEGVGVTEHLGAMVPLDLAFLSELGQPVRLGDYFHHERPVLLTMNYSDCPMLCSLQLDGFVESLKDLKFTLGDDFDVVTVSLNPSESPDRAKATQQKYLKQYGRMVSTASQRGWHFLTGSEASIQALAKSLGFGYRYMPDTKEYAHTAAVFVLSPEGKISRYLYGVLYDAQTLRLSMVEAAQGKVGSPLDQILLTCFHYDASKGKYAPVARQVMTASGVLVLLVLGLFLWRLMRQERIERSQPKQM